MKRSLKILTLVLSLALICGALVVAAFAGDGEEITGIETKLYWDFNNLPDGDLSYGGDGKYYFTSMTPMQGAGYNFYDSSSRQGYASIVKNGENNYFQWTAADHTCTRSANDGNVCATCGKTLNGYIGAGITDKMCGGPYTSNSTNYIVDPDTKLFTGETVQDGTIDKFDFIAEVDVWAPEGYEFSESKTIIKFHINGVGYEVGDKGAVTYRVNWAGQLIPNVYLTSDDNGNYVQLANGRQKMYVDDNSWAHVTLATHCVPVDDYIEVWATVWVNGEYLETAKVGDTNSVTIGNQSQWLFANKTSMFYGAELRIQVTGAHSIENGAVAVDNMMVRQINREEYKSNGGNLYEIINGQKNLYDWDANVYNRDNMPYGTTVAVNEDTGVEYDYLQHALDSAKSGETVVLSANVTSNVVINQDFVTLRTGEFTCGTITAGEGLSIFEENGEWWTEDGGLVEILWADCECGLDVCDETHPGYTSTYVGIGGNIFDSYVAEGKSHTWSYVDEATLTTYKLAGWQDSDGNVYTADDVITLEYVNEYGDILELFPVITTSVPVYEYTKNGQTTYGFADSIIFADAVQSADAGTTFKLLGDVLALNWYSESGVQPKDGVTFDLNGYSLFWVQDQNSTKSILFCAAKDRTINITTTKPGGKILSGKMISNATNQSANQGGAVFAIGGTNATINVDGTNGLEIMSAQLALSDGANYGSLNITGGTYVQPYLAQDSWAVMQMCCFKELNLKDATFITFISNRNIVGTMGNGAAPAEGSKVNIDGCNFVGGIFNRGDFPELEVNVTNSYIQGKIDLSERFNPRGGGRDTHGMAGGKWTFGDGCYFGTDISTSGVSLAEGYVLYDTTETVNYTYTTNKWTYGDVAASTVFTTETTSATYIKATGKYVAPITVNWKDAQGNDLGSTTATPGQIALSLTVPVEGTDGWVMAAYSYKLPEEATEGYVVTVDENTDVTYSAGKVPVYVNYTIVLHFEVNIYYPTNAPEGITNVIPSNNNSVPAANRIYSGAVIGGKDMNRFCAYPGASNADNDMNIAITFDYNGQTIVYNAPAFNIGDYAQSIFNGEYTETMKKAVLAMINYVDAASKATAKNPTREDLVAAQSLAAEKGITVENVVIDTENKGSYDAISEYVSGVQLAIGSQGGVQLQFIAKDPTNAAKLKLNYLWESGKQHKNQNWFNEGFWYCHNTWAYTFDDNCTIQIVSADGEVLAECEYSVWNYAAAMWDQLSVEQQNLIIATLTWAKYAETIRV